MKIIFVTAALLLLLGGGPQLAAAKGDILYRTQCLCGYRGWERKYIANGRPPLAPEPTNKPPPPPEAPYGFPLRAPPPVGDIDGIYPYIPPPPGPRPPPPPPSTTTVFVTKADTTPTGTPAAPAVPTEGVVVAKSLVRREPVYEDLILAYFLKMTFYQHHIGLNFTFTRECAPGAPCHDYSRTHRRCERFAIDPKERKKYTYHRHQYHKFCYQIRDLPKWDQYWFDGQRRSANVEKAKSPYMTEAQPIITEELQEVCGRECKARFGMEVIGGKAKWRSMIDKITGEDDMCDGCP